MKGRIKRLQAALNKAPSAGKFEQQLICPLCERLIPPVQRDAHHLVPKSRGGTETVWLHRICHRQIHALLTENELARHYHQVSLLREHPELASFIRWLRRKPQDFFERTRKSNRLRSLTAK
jgi:hypothetical protein